MKISIYPWQSLKTRVTLLSLVIFTVVIWSPAYYASMMLRKDLQIMLGEQQFSTATIVAGNLNQDIEFCTSSLKKVAAGITPAMFNNSARLQAYIEGQPILRDLFNGGYYAVRTDGTAIADVPRSTGRVGMNVSGKGWMIEALQGNFAIGRPVIGKMLQVPVFTMAAPILDTSGMVLGVLAGVIDLSKPNFMKEVTDNRYGKTGDYLLVAPQHRLVVTSSDKRLVMRQLPAAGVNPDIDRNIEGFEGYSIYVNPVGVEQLSAIKKIPAAGWYLAVALPTAEAFTPIDTMQKRVMAAALVLTVLAGLLSWWMLKRQLSPMLEAVKELRAISDTEIPVSPLPVTRLDEVGLLLGAFNRLLEQLACREARLTESEERWKFALEGAGDGIWDWNAVTNQVFYSRQWKAMLGYSDEEIGETLDEWDSRVHPADKASVYADLERHFHGETDVYTNEHRMRCKDGTYKWILDRGKAIAKTADGKPLRVIGTHTDITFRREAEKKLVGSERFLRMLTNNIPGMVGYWTSELRCTFANNAYLEWFGRTEDQMLGISMQELMGEELFSKNEPSVRRALQGETQHFERTLVKPSGETGYTWAHYIPDLEEGSVKGFFVLVADVTELKKAEEEKAFLQSRLQQSQKLESVGRLAGGIAHDFNNKLMVILGNAELATMNLGNTEKITDHLQEITRAAEHSRDITAQLLAFSRQQVIMPRLLNANDLIAETQKTLPRLIGEHISFIFTPYDGLWSIEIDPVQLDQIVMNLAVIARDAMPNGGTFTIATGNISVDGKLCQTLNDCVPGDYVRLSFTDTGTGIDDKTIKHIFEPFFTTKDQGKGTGLGLATIYGIIRQNNGFIDVISRPGEGTQFSVYLPRKNAPAEEMIHREPNIQKGAGAILLVEDEGPVRKVTSLFLRNLGYQVYEAENPGTAMEICSDSSMGIDLVLTDVIMPEMNGNQLLKMIRETRPDIKALFVSGYTADHIALEELSNYGNFIQKPYDLNKLGECLKKTLEG